MKVFEVAVDISVAQSRNDARRCISREYPFKYVFKKEQLPKDFKIVGKFRHNISGLSMPHWCHVFYVKV